MKAKRGGITAAIMKKIRSVLFFMDNSGSQGLIDALAETVWRILRFRLLNCAQD
jgi:hypothetical protein